MRVRGERARAPYVRVLHTQPRPSFTMLTLRTRRAPGARGRGAYSRKFRVSQMRAYPNSTPPSKPVELRTIKPYFTPSWRIPANTSEHSVTSSSRSSLLIAHTEHTISAARAHASRAPNLPAAIRTHTLVAAVALSVFSAPRALFVASKSLYHTTPQCSAPNMLKHVPNKGMCVCGVVKCGRV